MGIVEILIHIRRIDDHAGIVVVGRRGRRFVFVQNSPLDTGVLDANVRARELVQRLQQRGTLFRRNAVRQAAIGFYDFRRQLRYRCVGLLRRWLLRHFLRQVGERIKSAAAVSTADLAGRLFQDLGCHSKCYFAIWALRIHA